MSGQRREEEHMEQAPSRRRRRLTRERDAARFDAAKMAMENERIRAEVARLKRENERLQQYAFTLGRIDSALGLVGTPPLDDVVLAVQRVVNDVAILRAYAERMRIDHAQALSSARAAALEDAAGIAAGFMRPTDGRIIAATIRAAAKEER